MSFGNSSRGYQSVGDRFDQEDTGYKNGGFGNTQPYATRDVEMNTYSDGPGPNILRDRARALESDVDKLDRDLDALELTFRQSLARPDMPTGEIESKSATIMATYHHLVQEMRNIKSATQANNSQCAPHIGKADRRLKATMQKYQTLEATFRRESQQAAERQFRIVRPDATDAEVREAVQDPSAQIFSQALLSSDRRGQAQSTLSNVQQRHKAIQNIERQMVELSQLFIELDTMTQQQDPMTQEIEQKGEMVREDVTKGNEEIGTAIVSARARNRKKWWCLLICILILIVIAIIVAVVVVTNNNKNKVTNP